MLLIFGGPVTRLTPRMLFGLSSSEYLFHQKFEARIKLQESLGSDFQ